MADGVCPGCGALLKGERPKFCHECGCNLLEFVPQADDVSPGQPTGCADEAVPPSDAGLSVTPESVGMAEVLHVEPQSSMPSGGSASVASQERQVGAGDGQEARRAPTSQGLALSINTNQFYMEGLSGVLEIKLENLGQATFDLIEVEVAGNLVDRTECWACALEQCDHVQKRYPVMPRNPGVAMVTFRVNAREGDVVRSYWAEGDLLVFANTQNLHEVKLQADNMVNVSAGTGKQMGNSVNNNINIMVDQGKIRNVNDLMLEYRKLSPDFQLVRLFLDPKRSDELTQAFRRMQDATRGKCVVDPQRGTLTDAASLLINDKGKTENILLLAKSCVTLGKNRRNDIVTRFGPRSPENDAQSNQMSRDHCRIELRQGGLVVLDEGSINGTTLDGHKVDAGGRLIQEQTKTLVLGDVFSLSVRHISGHLRTPCGEYADAMSEPPGDMWDLTHPAGPAALVLQRADNLGLADKNGSESYCLVCRVATIGSGHDCAICFPGRGLEALHAAIVYWSGRFFLENLSKSTDVAINDSPLPYRSLKPLAFGDCIRIAGLDMQLAPRCQLFVDV